MYYYIDRYIDTDIYILYHRDPESSDKQMDREGLIQRGESQVELWQLLNGSDTSPPFSFQPVSHLQSCCQVNDLVFH